LSEVCGDKTCEATSLLEVWWLERSSTQVPVERGEVPLKRHFYRESLILLEMAILGEIT